MEEEKEEEKIIPDRHDFFLFLFVETSIKIIQLNDK